MCSANASPLSLSLSISVSLTHSSLSLFLFLTLSSLGILVDIKEFEKSSPKRLDSSLLNDPLVYSVRVRRAASPMASIQRLFSRVGFLKTAFLSTSVSMELRSPVRGHLLDTTIVDLMSATLQGERATGRTVYDI